MSAHTPGPWKTRGVGIYGSSVQIAEACSMKQRPGSTLQADQAAANARLIAAAPDLLEACKAVLEQFDSGALVRNTDSDGLSDWVLRAIQPLKALTDMKGAIAKAEGQ